MNSLQAIKKESEMELLLQISLKIQQLNKKMEKQFGMSLTQWYVLNALVDLPGVSPVKLSQVVGISPGSLTQSLKRLANKKWITIVSDHSDNRRKLISITREGKNARDTIDYKLLQIKKTLTPLLTPLDELKKILSSSMIF
ncbi:MAG: MarR family transcriptional regulator [Oligoflexia bacterium]|nr:MarR family transcriptional regulator [Oligoflexia bacterium]